MIYGLEKAPTTGTEHLHLYVRLNSRLYKATLKSLFPRACVEIARGDELQCYNYCSKNGEHTHTVCVPYYKAAPYNISHTKIFQWRFSL